LDYFPLNLYLKNKSCLIIGGGSVALRKAILLSKTDAKINVVSPQIKAELLSLVRQSNGTYLDHEFETNDIKDYFLVIAATNNYDVNEKVSEEARKKNILVNVVDTPELCDFIFPAIIDRDPLVVSVSSSGSSPVLARKVRSNIELNLPSNTNHLSKFISDKRLYVKNFYKNDEQKIRLFWEFFVESDFAERVLNYHPTVNDDSFKNLLNDFTEESVFCGEVFIVGAGPGDPDLLTFKALRLIQRADVVVYDRLVPQKIVDMSRRDADRIYVGKAADDHTIPQEEMNQLLVDLASSGKKVLRLKGGDPFIFGRGGEEVEFLANNKIPFQIVPGISAANGCACYAGIPLTHRDHSQSVQFITGHMKNGEINLPWESLATANQTIVIYMGLISLEKICSKLIHHGLEKDTKIALIEKGTLPNQRVHVSTLDSIVNVVKSENISAPVLIIIGSVVSLYKS
tara:strand:+ start:684 stop:2054 length:1371 start_codon:yes stop_codon:yes gene_type:complete